jgi:hypothetical protein
MICSAAIFDFGIFPCVDANIGNFDGCNSNCEVEKGW